MPHYEALPLGRLAKDPDACGVLLERLRQWAGDQGLRSIAFEYLAPEAAVLTDALRAAGWPVVEFAARCDLHVTWSDFDGYMDTLSSRRRVRVRRELRALDEAGVRVATRALRDEEPELVDLRCQLVVKYGGTADHAKEASMIRRLRSCFGDDEITVVTAERGGKTLGFGVFVQDGETWMPTLAGADYTDPHSRLTYFATLFYKPIELAPERGIRIIPYGLGSWQAKQLRGCVAAPLYGAALRLDGHL
ncbi:GNAT family N-acetyltransferase [Streptomyces sp. MB22_4]|uniref:GNAT family N-acetyltransferase n=1 Tax=unclassified Streptomyces TaxID=2593676 RepID=UPI00376ED40E